MINSENHLLVEARPLEPVMRVFNGGKSYYINREGKRSMQRLNSSPMCRWSAATSPLHLRLRMLPLVKYIDSDPKLANLTGMIVARDSRNLILVPRIKGHVVNFGDTTRMKEKKPQSFPFLPQGDAAQGMDGI